MTGDTVDEAVEVEERIVWLSAIGDSEYAEKYSSFCDVESIEEDGYVPVYMQIGYSVSSGVNYINLVFAPSYGNEDSSNELRLTIGERS